MRKLLVLLFLLLVGPAYAANRLLLFFGTGAHITLAKNIALPAGLNPVNLTTYASSLNSDWSHWGLTNSTTWDHKSTGGSQISNVTVTGTPSRSNAFGATTTWTDGTPDASATNSGTGIYTNGAGNGFTFTVPADSNERTLSVFTDSFGIGTNLISTLTATLSDGSALPLVTTVTAGTVSNLYWYFMIKYKAATPGAHMTITWKGDSAGNNVLFSAALNEP